MSVFFCNLAIDSSVFFLFQINVVLGRHPKKIVMFSASFLVGVLAIANKIYESAGIIDYFNSFSEVGSVSLSTKNVLSIPTGWFANRQFSIRQAPFRSVM